MPLTMTGLETSGKKTYQTQNAIDVKIAFNKHIIFSIVRYQNTEFLLRNFDLLVWPRSELHLFHHPTIIIL